MSDWIDAEGPPRLRVPPIIEPEPGVPQRIIDYSDPTKLFGKASPMKSPVEQIRSRAAGGPVSAGVLSAGKELRDLATGLQQVATLDPAKSAALQAEYEGRQAQFEPTAEEYPISTMVGAASPYILPSALGYGATKAGVQQALKYSPVAKRSLTTPAKLGALSGGLEGSVIGAIHPGMTAGTGAAVGALGGGLGGGLGSVLSRRPTDLTKQDKQMIKAAKDMKVSLLPGDVTRIPQLMREDAALLANPRTAKPYEDIKRYNTEILNQNVLQTTGLDDVSNVTADVISDLENSLSSRYKNLISISEGKFDEAMLDSFDKAVTVAERRLGGTKSKLLRDYMNRLDRISDDNLDISGEAYQNLYSDLTDQYSKRYKSQSPKAKTEADALKSMRDALIDNVEKGLPKDYKGKWGKLRSDYAATRLLMDNNIVDQSGNINYKRLSSVLRRKQNVKNFQKETGPWKQMIKAAKVGDWMASKPRYWVGGGSRIPGSQSGVKASLAGTILGRTSELPFAGRALSGLYRSGYPHITGYAGLPEATPRLSGILGTAGALGEED